MNNKIKIIQLKIGSEKSLKESEKLLNDLSLGNWNLINICESESDNIKLAFLKRKTNNRTNNTKR